jgi:hypothetical protein
MARRTKFQPGDLVCVTYNTRYNSGNFYGKVVEYLSEARQYRVGILAIRGYRDSARPLTKPVALWCNVGELEFVTEAQRTIIENVSYLPIALPCISVRTWSTTPISQQVSKGIVSALQATAHIPDSANLADMDVSGYPSSSRRRWLDIY